MTIENDSVRWIESHISNNYKEIFDKYLLDSMEWLEFDDHARPFARLMDLDANKLSEIIVLFPPFIVNNNIPNNTK